MTKDDGKYVIIGWNAHDLRDGKAAPDAEYRLKLPSLGKQAVLLYSVVGGAHANPMQTWSNLGKPRSLTKEQIEILRASAEPLVFSEKLPEHDGAYETLVTIQCNHLCMLEILPVEDQTDTYEGYDPIEFYGLK